MLSRKRSGGEADKITVHNAGWRSQFRFAGSVFWSGVREFWRWAI
jgi:hypothetical protein